MRELPEYDNDPKELKVYIIPDQEKEIVIDIKYQNHQK